MKKTIIYTSTALMLAFSACNNAGEESAEAEAVEGLHSEDLHTKHTDQEDVQDREAYIKMVTAEEVAAFQTVDPIAANNMKILAAQYLELKEAFVNTNPQVATNIAGAMLQNLKAWEGNDLPQGQEEFYQERSDRMSDNLRLMVNNEEPDKQLDHFARLTKHMTELLQAFGTPENTLYYQYCPMAFQNKGAYWISSTQEIQNPYYPETMPKCGRVVKEL